MTDVAWFDAEEWQKEYMENMEHSFDIDFFSQSLDESSADKLGGYDAVTVFVDSDVSAEVIDSMDAKIIATRSTGFDHIDTGHAARNGVMVSNVPSYGPSTVAEHTFGLLLNLTRKISEAEEQVEEGNFSHKGLMGTDLDGKKIGVIGTGDIGQRVIEIARGFNMDVIAYDPYPKQHLEHEIGFMYVDLEDLIEQSDIISLHAPLTDSNHHLLSEEQFEMMEDTIILNTARGGLVDTEALIEALEDGSVRSAGLDVLEDESMMKDDVEVLSKAQSENDIEKVLEDHILVDRDDVIVTPHNAFNSKEALHRIVETSVKNIEERKNVVNNPWS